MPSNCSRRRSLDPKNPAYVLSSAELMVRLDRASDALALIESKLTTLDPTAGMFCAAGKIAMLLNQHEKAANYYAKARGLSPDDTDIQAQLAKAYFFAARFPMAIRELEDLLSKSPDKSQPWMKTMLAESYLADNQPAKAKTIFAELTRSQPQSATNWAGLAKSSLAADDFARASVAAGSLDHRPAGGCGHRHGLRSAPPGQERAGQ